MDVDIVIKNVREMQKERECLESKFKELRAKRQVVESKMESLSLRYGQVKDVHAKMSETLKVAQHKVAHSQSQMDAVEILNNERTSVVEECEDEVTNEIKEQREVLQEFQARLETISEQLIGAHQHYSGENLKAKIAECNKEQRVCETDTVHVLKDIEQLSKKLDDLENNAEGIGLEIPVDEQKAVIQAAEEERSTLLASMESEQLKKQELQAEFEKI